MGDHNTTDTPDHEARVARSLSIGGEGKEAKPAIQSFEGSGEGIDHFMLVLILLIVVIVLLLTGGGYYGRRRRV